MPCKHLSPGNGLDTSAHNFRKIGGLESNKGDHRRGFSTQWAANGKRIAFRAGYWNIGAEGQLLAGAIAAAGVALYVGDLPTKGLPAIVDWRHFRAAHAGICIYQGDQWPAEWRGLVFIGNIHESALNCDRLTPVGSTYKAERETKLLGPRKGDYQMGGGTFLASDYRWFRPVATHTGPDGAMWIADWCDKYPCYQNAQADPEGVDREMGRIWRVVWVGNEKGKKVASRSLN